MGLIPASAGQTSPPRAAGLRAGAHPRECGADREADRGEAKAEGSSPRVRGRPARRRNSAHTRGLIPASAGQTYRVLLDLWRGWAHPRECGADTCMAQPRLIWRGSSPRVRGRLSHQTRGSHRPGLIPASAGQTPHNVHRMGQRGAHPRECGADCASRPPPGLVVGSSPRVRGRPYRWHDDHHRRGLIPASAGQTPSSGRCAQNAGAHPRECGADRRLRPGRSCP